MATVRGNVAGDDWDDFGVGALGIACHKRDFGSGARSSWIDGQGRK